MVRTLACLSLRAFCTLLQSVDTRDMRDIRSCGSMAEVFDELWDDRTAFDLVLLEGIPDRADELRFLPESYPEIAFCVVGRARIGTDAMAGNVTCFETFGHLLAHVGLSDRVGLQRAS